MPKVIITSRPGSPYDDAPGVRYHFPRTYLKAVREAEGDWAVYYELRREGGHFYESSLDLGAGGVNLGTFQRAVRRQPEDQFALIVQR